jgi:hypothetical protein
MVFSVRSALKAVSTEVHGPMFILAVGKGIRVYHSSQANSYVVHAATGENPTT